MQLVREREERRIGASMQHIRPQEQMSLKGTKLVSLSWTLTLIPHALGQIVGYYQ
jgi:hypothetical protein